MCTAEWRTVGSAAMQCNAVLCDAADAERCCSACCSLTFVCSFPTVLQVQCSMAVALLHYYCCYRCTTIALQVGWWGGGLIKESISCENKEQDKRWRWRQ